MPDINMQVFEEVQRNQLVTEVDIQTQVALDDYQVQLLDIANPTQSQDNVIIDRFGEFLPHWNESLDFDTWIKMSMEVAGKRILMFRGNSSISGASSISDTMIFGDDFPGSSIDTSKWDVQIGTPVVSNGELSITGTASEKITSDSMFGVNTILTTKMKEVSQVNYGGFGFTKQTSAGLVTNDISVIYQYSSTGYADNRVGGVLDYSTFTWGDTNYHIFEITRNGAVSTIYEMDGSVVSTRTTQVSSGDMYITAAMGVPTTINQIYANIYLRKYVATEPMQLADDIPKNIAIALKSLGRAG